MRISSMAAKNLRGNLYRYIMYYLSNVFAVSVFFIFANFVFHPNLNGPVAPHIVAQMGAKNGIIACQVIIVIFSVLFVTYATSIFIKSRGKEFGLLSLFGMTNGQIRKYVLIEGTIIAAISIVTGLAVGTLFSKLFFMAMEAFMDISLPFNISLKAILLTILIFFGLFEVVNIITLFQIRNKEIVEQLKTDRIPKIIPKFSKGRAILGVVLLVLGYVTAWLVQGVFVALAMIPVVIIVIAGTYFVFTEFSVAVANKITKSKKIFYNRTNMIAFSQMIFKLQDTAKVLFLAAILGAITFTATETIYSFFTEAPEISGLKTPEEMIIIQKGETLNDAESIARAKSILKENHFNITEHHQIRAIEVINETVIDEDNHEGKMLTISNSDYNMIANYIGREQLTVNEKELVYIYPYETYDVNGKPANVVRLPYESVRLNLNREVNEYKVSGEIHEEIMSIRGVGFFDVMVLNDTDFSHLLDIAEENDIIIYNGFHLDRWQLAYNASIEIQEMLGSRYEGSFYAKAIPFKQISRSFGLTLFIGFFIAFLFFIASGSIIYFKLFNEIKQDGIEYNILKKIGITKKEMNRMITKQIAVIFFLPFVVSTMHSLFALKSLSNLLKANLLTNGLVVMMGYFIFQGLYFLVIRKIYINRIRCLTIQ